MSFLLLALSLAYPTPPQCSGGTAWVNYLSDPPAMLLQAKCDGCEAECRNAGTKSEGWYSSCDGALIQWTDCNPDDAVACTMDAKMCPDGSYVGRQAPDCEFAACPGEQTTSCDPYVCSDGTTAPSCTEDGHVINYFVAPCRLHGGEEGAPFGDVTSDHPNADAIFYVKMQAIVEGYQDGTYKPDNTINRAEFVKILMGAFPGDDRMCKIAPFADVDQSAWYATFAHAARCQGVVSGYDDGTFRPANDINFVEAAKIISLASGIAMPGRSESDEWFAPYVRDLERHHAIPISITSFDQPITRGEMAEMIYRLKTGNADKPSRTYDDLRLNTQESVEVTLYFGDAETIRTSDCSAVLPSKRHIAKTSAVADATLRLLFQGVNEQEKAQGMLSPYEINEPVGGKPVEPLAAYYRGVTVVDGMATVKFSEGAEAYLEGGLCQQEAGRMPIVATLKQFSTIQGVRFTINGNVVEEIQP